jgi:DNA-directed RNA polymerase subunit L
MESVKTTLNGYRLDGELKNVPVSFVNGLRRILLAEIPTVVVSNVEILDNSTPLTHEMLRHRIEQLPVNALVSETGILRDTKIEVRYLLDTASREVTTDDFVVTGPRKNVLLHDRDLDTPGYFMTLGPNQSLHVKATLGVEMRGASQVCVATYKNHIDPDVAKVDRDTWIAENNDPAEFDAFHIQRSFARNEQGRPYWFDLAVESIGVAPASDLIKTACEVYAEKLKEVGRVPIQRLETNQYRMKIPGETYTVGALAQAMIYDAGLVDWVRMDCGHPLLPELTLEFTTKVSPEKVVERFVSEALALCENVLKSV